jgi:hypothetical protein
MTTLTRQQIEQMKKQGLSEDKIASLAQSRGLKMPSASIGGFLGKAARFTGVEKLGQGLGYSLFQLTPEYRNLEKLLNDGKVSPNEWEELTTGNITSGEVLGSGVRTAATTVGAGQLLGAPKAILAGQTGSAFGKARLGAQIGAGVGGTIGGAQGLVSGLREGEGVSGAVRRAASGAFGGGLVGAGVGALGGGMTSPAFRQGALMGAKEGGLGGALIGAGQGAGAALEEDKDMTGLAADTVAGGIRGGVTGGLFGGLLGGTVGAGAARWKNYVAQKQTIADALRKQSDDVISGKNAAYNLEETVRGALVKRDKVFANAVRDTGLSPDDIAIVKSSRPGDYSAYRDMIRVAKSDDLLSVQKPIERAGQTVIRRLEDVNTAQQQAAREIGEIASTRLNRTIPELQTPLIQLSDDLGARGVSVGKDGSLDFRGSDFEDLPGVQRILQTIYRRAGELDNNGYRAHQLKRFIDEQITYGKQVEGLTGTSEKLIKTFRRNVDGVLDAADGGYNAANTRYATARDAQGEMQRLLGKDFNITDEFASMRAGEVMSRTLGNASARPLQVLTDLEKAAKQLGYTYDDNVIAQIKFADMLEDVTGAPSRSLGGQMENAGRRIVGLPDWVQKSLPFADNADAFLKKAMGQTPEMRLDALEMYLNSLAK